MTSQALLVVLAPTIAAIGRDLGVSVAAVGQARTVTAVAAVAASLAITPRVGALGVRRLLVFGAFAGLAACAAVASASSLMAFLSAHILVGAASACLLTAGFAGVVAFPYGHRPWAIGYVAAANALAWILASPLMGSATQLFSWRLAHGVPGLLAIATLLTARRAAAAGEAQSSPSLRTIVSDRSARRWIVAELLAYASWTGLLTFVGAFFVQRIGVGEAATGWLLAAGASAHFVASTRSAVLVARVPRSAWPYRRSLCCGYVTRPPVAPPTPPCTMA